MIYLGIDTSCYTTSIAAVDESGQVAAQRRKLLSVPDGQRGLRQSEGFYQHVNALPGLYREMIEEIAGPITIGALAVSARPRACAGSYMPVFYAGVRMAEMIAHTAGIQLIETDHQSGHICAALMGSALKSEHFLAVHLSGGTTEILEVYMKHGIPQCKILLATGDISAGQLIDRVGVALGFAFPAGKYMDDLAIRHEGIRIKLPYYVDNEKCSFSGTETATMKAIQNGVEKEVIAEGIMAVVCKSLVHMLYQAALRSGCMEVLLSGGVSSSKYLRATLQGALAQKAPGIHVYFSDPALSADNAVGTARIAWLRREQAPERKE